MSTIKTCDDQGTSGFRSAPGRACGSTRRFPPLSFFICLFSILHSTILAVSRAGRSARGASETVTVVLPGSPRTCLRLLYSSLTNDQQLLDWKLEPVVRLTFEFHRLIWCRMKIQILIEHDSESGWLIATSPELPGFVTQAETEEDLLHNIKEAVTLWIEVDEEKRGLPQSSHEPHLKELALTI